MIRTSDIDAVVDKAEGLLVLPRIGCGATALASWEIAIDDGAEAAPDYDVPSLAERRVAEDAAKRT